ncbi:MAG: ABC transporter permease, partial [Thermosynechococcaceae cyanobacterium]
PKVFNGGQSLMVTIPHRPLSPRQGMLQQGIRQMSRQVLGVYAALAYAFLYLPILILVIYSFNDSRFNAVWHGFTLKWYQSLFQGTSSLGLIQTNTTSLNSDGVLAALQMSLWVATVSTAIATVLGTSLAIAMEQYRFRGKLAIEALIYLPIIIPEITMGISLLVLFTLVFRLLETLTGIRLALGVPTVMIGHVAFTLSFVTVVVRARLADLDPSLAEAAMDLGASEWRILRRITLPLIWPAILSGALLAFTLSLDDFVVTFFISGVGATTLPLFVYGMIKFSVTPAINAISTLMLLVSIVLVIASLTSDRLRRLEENRSSAPS